MRKTTKILTSVVALSLMISLSMSTAEAYPYQQDLQPMPKQYQYASNYAPPLQGRVVIIPAGTVMNSVATTTISTATLVQGDSVSFVLNAPFFYNGVMIAPAGSTINGNAIIAQKGGLAGKYGKLKILFTNIMTPQGQVITISGKIATQDQTGILVGGTTKERAVGIAKDAAIGSAAGALLGTALGPMSGGSVGKGAVFGTALGAGLGLGKAVIDKGQDVVIQPGEAIQIQLDQPVSVNPSNR